MEERATEEEQRCASASVRVRVREGWLRGRLCRTRSGTPFRSFQGVPYAQPPLAELRFQAPRPAAPWGGERDATQPGSRCAQFDPLRFAFDGSEDCLSLAVHAPCCAGRAQGLPVMVWLHGGGFASGGGDAFGPAPLMDRRVVLVTVNYRLGALGFLSLGCAEAPGNAGLKDQVAALRWLRRNIAAFGGDATNVTVFGSSSGAVCAHLLTLSPLARGLVRRAVVQSGSAWGAGALQREPAAALALARRLGAALGLGLEGDGDDRLLAGLRAVPALALVRGAGRLLSAAERRRGRVRTFVPCVEPPLPGAFLPAPPPALLPRAPPLDVVFGLNAHEGLLFLPDALLRLSHFHAPPGDSGPGPGPGGGPDGGGPDDGGPPSAAQRAAARARYLAELRADPSLLLPPGGEPSALLERVRRFYWGTRPFDDGDATVRALVDVRTDALVAVAVVAAARAHAACGWRVYAYEFAFRGRLNAFSALLLPPPPPGEAERGGRWAGHGDELPYLFELPGVAAPAPGSAEQRMRRRLTRLWAAFADSGDPSPRWPPFEVAATPPRCLHISRRGLRARPGPLAQRMRFWDELCAALRPAPAPAAHGPPRPRSSGSSNEPSTGRRAAIIPSAPVQSDA